MNGEPVYDYDDVVNFIKEKSGLDVDVIEKVLDLEEEYMRSIGIIDEDE